METLLLRRRSCREESQEVVSAFPMALDFSGFAIRKAIVRSYDAHAFATTIECWRPEGAAQLQPKLSPIARSDRFEDVYRPSHGVRQSQYLWPPSPDSLVSHRGAVRLRGHVILLGSSTHELVDGNRLISLQVQSAIRV